jgi:hypothetical protein
MVGTPSPAISCGPLGETLTVQPPDALSEPPPVAFHFTTRSGTGSSHPKPVLQVTAQRPIARTVRLANTRAGAAGCTEENPCPTPSRPPRPVPRPL